MPKVTLPSPMFYDYTLLAHFKGEIVVHYWSEANQNGDWVMVTRLGDTFHIYKDWFGSCSHCDFILRHFEDETEVEAAVITDFIKSFPPFISMDAETMQRIIDAGVLHTVFPRNIWFIGGAIPKYVNEVILPDILKSFQDFDESLEPLIIKALEEMKHGTADDIKSAVLGIYTRPHNLRSVENALDSLMKKKLVEHHFEMSLKVWTLAKNTED